MLGAICSSGGKLHKPILSPLKTSTPFAKDPLDPIEEFGLLFCISAQKSIK
jgi:hypothetical protein